MAAETFPTLAELLADAHWVRGLASTLADNAHDADDLAQEACLVALRLPPRHEHNLRGWFQRVLTNLVRQGARARVRRQQRERTLAERTAAGEWTHDLVERAATHRTVVDAVLALDQPYRDTILLRFFEDLPPRSIAARMGVTVATVHSRLQRGCARLRQHLDRTFGQRDKWRSAFLPLSLATPLPPLGVFVMNLKVVSVAAAVVIGTAALWFGLRSDDAADVPVHTKENAAVATQELDRTRGITTPTAGEAERVKAAPAAPDKPVRPSLRQIAGRVVDAEGRPAAVRVKFADARARSDKTGAFTLPTEGLDGGIVRTDEPAWRTVMHSVVPASATPPPALVVAAPALVLAGDVRTAAGEAVAGATLRVAWPVDLRNRLTDIMDTSAEEDMAARSRTDGSFALDAAKVRGAWLVVTAEGFVPARLPLPEQDTTALRITLERPQAKPGTIQGQVVDPHGMPVADARIGLGAAVVRSDAQGNFLIDDDGRSRTLAAAMVGHRRGAVERTGTGFPPFVVIALGAVPLSIRGRVVDQDGKGLTAITIWTNDPTPLCDSREPLASEGIAAGCKTMDELRAAYERGEFTNPEQVMRDTPTAGWPFVRSEADGSFVLNGLEDRPYRLRAMDQATLLMVEQDGVAAGSKDVQLVLRQEELFMTMKGIVVARNGEPVPGVRVQAQIDTLRMGGSTRHGRSEARDTTDAEGRFLLPKVPKRHVYLRLDGDRILPVEHGRGVAGGLLELTGGRVDDLRIEVGVRMHVQVELLDPASADSMAVLDGAGKTIIVNVFSGRGRRETGSLEFADGKSPVFVVPDTAATLVLSKAGKEVRRETLQLRAGDVNTLRY